MSITKSTYTFSLGPGPVSNEDKEALKGYIDESGLNESNWGLYDSLFNSASKYSIPLILRMKSGKELVALVVLIKCYKYGLTITGARPLIKLIELFRLPVHVWMKSGIAAELLANPGFINPNYNPGVVLPIILDYMKKTFFMSFILDTEENEPHHANSIKFPYPDDGIIDMKEVTDYKNYISLHKNIKKKLRHFRNKGGRIDIVRGRLPEKDIELVGKCVESTSKRSVFKLPYQENYARMCKASAAMEDENVIHFICKTESDFLGYHSFLDFGKQLRCINGAFNRELKTTHHAYENMIARVVEYASSKGIEKIYFGPVLNETKQRMMHSFQSLTTYFTSNNILVRTIFPPVLRNSRMMNKSVMRFRNLQHNASLVSLNA